MAEQEIAKKTNRSKRWGWLALPLLLAVAYVALRPGAEADTDIASAPVEQGEFLISLELKGGELEAIKAENNH